MDRAGYLPQFEQGLSLTVFTLLKAHSRLSEERLTKVVSALQASIPTQLDVTVAVRFLQTGIEYFKNGDPRALLRLPTEERQLFVRDLGIEQKDGP